MSGLFKDFMLHDYPSNCGFAAGFEHQTTRTRALCEAVERWAWSKWIDEKVSIQKAVPHMPSELSQYFAETFEEVYFYSQMIRCDALPGGRCQLGIVVGLSDTGIFPGSRVCSLSEDPWEHAMLEAWRHYVIAKKGSEQQDLVYGRIQYFASHRREGLEQVPPPNPTPWPSPKILLDHGIKVRDVYLHRALCADYKGWHEGASTRFVY